MRQVIHVKHKLQPLAIYQTLRLLDTPPLVSYIRIIRTRNSKYPQMTQIHKIKYDFDFKIICENLRNLWI